MVESPLKTILLKPPSSAAGTPPRAIFLKVLFENYLII